MTDTNGPIGQAFEGPSPASSASRWGTTLAGMLIIVVGVAMLAERTGLLSLHWRANIWPLLLMLFGGASLLRPNPDGRHGLFFVFAGAWWYAGQVGWISMLQTWPLLIVGLGLSVMLQSFTAADLRSRHLWKHGRRESGLMPLLLVAILAGALFSSRDRLAAASTASDGSFHLVSVVGASRHQLAGTALPRGTFVTVMGANVLDLSQATVPADAPAVVDGLTIMGRSVLYVPDAWQVDTSSLSVFGSVRDHRHPPDAVAAAAATPTPRVQLRGAVVFGRVDLRSPSDAGTANGDDDDDDDDERQEQSGSRRENRP